MRIGVPKEVKSHEYRVGLTPASVRELVEAGQEVAVETGAGAAIGCNDVSYQSAGAQCLASAEAVFDWAELIVKVKEPSTQECAWLRPDQVLFTFLHLAADRELTQRLQDTGVSALAYETVTADDGSLPLLTPMSEVAGRLAVQAGAWCLQKATGGSGTLLGGVPGVQPGQVVVIGGGVAGSNAAEMAIGLNADVAVLDLSVPRLRQICHRFGNRVRTLHATREALESLLGTADLVVGAVLVPGARAPRVLTREQLGSMREGSVVVDISIDQGGCFETSRPTTHAQPTFIERGIVHYCVANMPGAVARTSTEALNAVTLPFVRRLACDGLKAALQRDKHLAAGLNVQAGRVVHPAVEAALAA